ncbi:MAG: precorrin-4 C(11)-methyltransferase [Desulfuromonadales bacterium]|nr:precorrin-4 C(11)-methyltransferase [Desulfuromonadales bacterium]
MDKVYFVGAGPGDAELITVKGARLLSEAQVVLYAGSLVDRALVNTYAPQAEIIDSAALNLAETTQILVANCRVGKKTIRLHTGDPAIFGAIQEQMAELDAHGIDYAVIPGVTSAFAAAAALRQELTLPEVSQTVIFTRIAGRTPVPEKEALDKLAAIGATLVIYLSVGVINQVVDALLAGAYTPESPVAVVARASWPDEQVLEGTLAEISELVRAAGINRQALIIVGDVLAARTKGMTAKSLLYDADFRHGYRSS